MSIPKQTFFRCIKEFKLKELFNELGWDNAKVKYTVKADDVVYDVTGVAQKKDFVIFLCGSTTGGSIPDSTSRKKIDNHITPLHHEHLIIYVDGKKTRQHWELLIREQNKPVVSRPIDYYAGQEPELLFQKLEGIFFTFEDEDKLSIVDVRSRVMANFEKNAEVVTKKFYERFEKEHEKFLGFIKGIQSKVDQEWYASLMLNRLMFIYFIQKKGFLDKNKDYLRTRLQVVQSKKGKDKFYSFYRSFLLILFHKGLGSPVRGADIEAEIGKVPYLNGGLFDVHELEHDNKDITIEDKAFERLFDFFDEYNWHLDTRITATGKDINPDVIGYIFEKYINDRAAMGAYYTKEDITEYISKNCIVPWLFDEVKRNYPKPFASARHPERAKRVEGGVEGVIWSFLQQSGDTYIYPAVKYGIISNSTEGNGFADLPDDVQSCIDPNTPDLVEKRKRWNRPAPSDIGLPTEIYREVIARRKRYYELRRKIVAGEISEINDFITYNLDIRQFAQDVLEQTDDPKLIMEFYKAVRKITVLDPTCGSGAFLFAALNVLEPLYFACVTRMREFIEQDARQKDGGQGKGKHKFFDEQLALIDADVHPSEEYFIYKSIILHNLYGVDIMKEAVEIAKLRLFLKLVASCDVDYSKPNLGLEPLPDIDFNIRSGNTLVGYATLADLDKSEQGGLFGDEEKQAILEEADVVSRAYARFKDAQLVMHSNPKTYKEAKDELSKRLTVLNNKLNRYLAVLYHKSDPTTEGYKRWLSSHQPFHWLSEFYTTIEKGGFDVIIGNPPYVEYKDVIKQYSIKNYETSNCKNLFAFTLERCRSLTHEGSRIGMIVPLSAFSTDRMIPLIEFIKTQSSRLNIANFSWRPGKLFDGVNIQLSIMLQEVGHSSPKIETTGYILWDSEARPELFSKISFHHAVDDRLKGSIPKLGYLEANSILTKLRSHQSELGSCFVPHSTKHVYYRRGGLYWKVFVNFITDSSEEKILNLSQDVGWEEVIATLSSTLWFWYFTVTSDCRHLGNRDINTFPFDLRKGDAAIRTELTTIGKQYVNDLKRKAESKVRVYKRKTSVDVISFSVKDSKPIIDEIDKVLAKHYGFTEEELDFIINYDIKYRMGKELGEEE